MYNKYNPKYIDELKINNSIINNNKNAIQNEIINSIKSVDGIFVNSVSSENVSGVSRIKDIKSVYSYNNKINNYYELNGNYVNNNGCVKSGVKANNVSGIIINKNNNDIITNDIIDINFVPTGVENDSYCNLSKNSGLDVFKFTKVINDVEVNSNIKVFYDHEYVFVVYYKIKDEQNDHSYIHIYDIHTRKLITSINDEYSINKLSLSYTSYNFKISRKSGVSWIIYSAEYICIYTASFDPVNYSLFTIAKIDSTITNGNKSIRKIVSYSNDYLFVATMPYPNNKLYKVDISTGKIIEDYGVFGDIKLYTSGYITSKAWMSNSKIYGIEYTRRITLYNITDNEKIADLYDRQLGFTNRYNLLESIDFGDYIIFTGGYLFHHGRNTDNYDNFIYVIHKYTLKFIKLDRLPKNEEYVYCTGIDKNNIMYLVGIKETEATKLYSLDLNNIGGSGYTQKFKLIKTFNTNLFKFRYAHFLIPGDNDVVHNQYVNILDNNTEMRDYNLVTTSMKEFIQGQNTSFILDEIYKLEQIYNNEYNNKRRL